MYFIKSQTDSTLTLQDVELQGICLTGESDYTFVNAPVGNTCNTMGGFTEQYINTR